MSHDDHSIAEHLSELAKIELSEQEKQTLNQSLKKMLNYTTLLEEIDVEGVPFCTNILENMVNVMDEDQPRVEFDRAVCFDNFPEHVGNMVKVPPVIEFEA